jgi:hypothetical protein
MHKSTKTKQYQDVNRRCGSTTVVFCKLRQTLLTGLTPFMLPLRYGTSAWHCFNIELTVAFCALSLTSVQLSLKQVRFVTGIGLLARMNFPS